MANKVMPNKVFVSGADGFIGSHLTEQLVRDGNQVKAFVCYNSWNTRGNLDQLKPEILNSVEIVTGDIRDFHSVREAMRGCATAYHLAALIGIPYSYQAQRSYVDTNIGGTLNVLMASRELDCTKVVHTSTSEVYGSAKFVPITEEHPLQSQSPYAATKIGADQLALSFFNSFACPVTVIRPFNTYGPRQSPRAVIPATIMQILSGANRLKLGALNPTRDFNFVTDTVKGFIAAGNSSRSIGEVINIGSNYEISIGDTVNLITELMGATIEIETDQARIRPDKSEVERLWADSSKAKKLLNWEPQYSGMTGLRKGLQETIDWFANAHNKQSEAQALVYNV